MLLKKKCPYCKNVLLLNKKDIKPITNSHKAEMIKQAKELVKQNKNPIEWEFLWFKKEKYTCDIIEHTNKIILSAPHIRCGIVTCIVCKEGFYITRE